jgi:hypothetical protein
MMIFFSPWLVSVGFIHVPLVIDHVARCKMLTGLFVVLLVEATDQFLEDGAHGEITVVSLQFCIAYVDTG